MFELSTYVAGALPDDRRGVQPACRTWAFCASPTSIRGCTRRPRRARSGLDSCCWRSSLSAFDAAVGFRALAGIGFIILTAPISAHLVARAAYVAGIRPTSLTNS